MTPRYWNPRVERLSKEELVRLQEARLTALLQRVVATNPWYRELYRSHGVDVNRIRSLADFRRCVPLITKQDLIRDQEAAPPYGTRMAAPLSEVATVVLTSGTSGRGREVHCYTFADMERSTAQFCYLLRWQGMDPGDRLFHTIPVGMELGGTWYKRGSEKFPLNYLNVAKYDTDTRLDYMRRFSPHLIMTSCAYLNRLTARCDELGINPRQAFPELKVLSIGTEPHSVPWAQQMEEHWGVRLQERFGSTQCGGTHLFSCEGGVHDGDRRRMMHNLGHKVIMEVLDPQTGEPVKSGDEGELVVTCLYMEAFPSIRFRMADRVRYMDSSECDCGRPFDGIACGSVARFDDMIKIKAYNIWPDTVDAVILGSREVAEYAARVFINEHGRETVLIRVEFETISRLSADERASLLGRFREELKVRTGVTMDLVEAPSGSVLRWEVKARRWTDERLQGIQGGAAPKVGST